MTTAGQETRYCTLCGVPKSTPFCTSCGADPDGVPPDLANLARRMNWGAFLLPGLWPLWHGRAMLALGWWIAILASVWMAWLGSFPFAAYAAVAIALYLLLYGNQVALSRRRFTDIGEFVSVETAWARWGIGVLVVGVAIAVAMLLDMQFAPS